jgi:release factor glutamine methyltransferase
MMAVGGDDGAVQPGLHEPCNGSGPLPFVWSLDRSSDVGRALLAASRRLREAGSASPQLDSVVLMAHVLGVSKTWLYAHPSRQLTEGEIEHYEILVRRRMCHEPVAYLVGYKSFFGLDITVDKRVLIPRPETELLVERALAYARELVREDHTPSIADVGTGSGAIAVALAVNLPQATVYATDLSEGALAVAEQNVWRYGVGEQVQLLPGNLLDPVPGPVDIVVANLPYVASEDLPHLAEQVRDYEPVLALDGGPGGLHVIRELLHSIADRPAEREKLRPGSRLYLEIGAGQGQALRSLVEQCLPGAQFNLLLDYADLDRVAVITL